MASVETVETVETEETENAPSAKAPSSADPLVIVADANDAPKPQTPSASHASVKEVIPKAAGSIPRLTSSVSRESVNSKELKSVEKKPASKEVKKNEQPEYPIKPCAPNLPPINPFNAQRWPNNGIVPFIGKYNFVSKPPISRALEAKKPPMLITKQLSEAERKATILESPYVINEERPLLPKARVQQYIAALPEKCTVAGVELKPRSSARQIYGYSVIVNPMCALIRADDEQCCEFFYEVTAREPVVVKIVIDNPSNFRIRPKLDHLKAEETGKFTLYYEPKKQMMYPKALMTVVIVKKSKFDEYMKTHPGATMKDVEHDGLIGIPIMVERYKKFDAEAYQKKLKSEHNNTTTTRESESNIEKIAKRTASRNTEEPSREKVVKKTASRTKNNTKERKPKKKRSKTTSRNSMDNKGTIEKKPSVSVASTVEQKKKITIKATNTPGVSEVSEKQSSKKVVPVVDGEKSANDL
uniref:Major sperm protein n=1 Tax=Panagrellus redivivus TaxID=6233 RepID=A0A7E4V493_PANRE